MLARSFLRSAILQSCNVCNGDHCGWRARPAVRRLAAQAVAGHRWAHAPRAQRRRLSRPSFRERGGGRPSARRRPRIRPRIFRAPPSRCAWSRAAHGVRTRSRTRFEAAAPRSEVISDPRRRAAVRVRRSDWPDDRCRRGPRRRDRGDRGQRHGEARSTSRHPGDPGPRDDLPRADAPGISPRGARGSLALGQSGVEATDEAALAERAGYAVHVVPGESNNIKITTPEDLDAVRSAAARREPAAPELATICTGSSRGVRSSSAA